jgi:hypothetical protein
MMKSSRIQFDLLFDADEYVQSGFFPWTFFAYPTSLASEQGLPPDNAACQMLAHLQDLGIDVAIWVDGIAEDTTYFACRREDIQRVNNAVQELETAGLLEKDFCATRSKRLFAALAGSTEQTDATEPE